MMSWPSRNRCPISCQIFILRFLKRSLPKSFIESPWQEIDVEDLEGFTIFQTFMSMFALN